MKPEILAYLTNQRTCVVAVEMLDGSPHGATVHFAHVADPLRIIVLTERRYRKAEPLLQKDKVRATIVVGTQDGDMKTFQADGVAVLTEDPALIRAYYEKFTNKDQSKLDDNDFFFVFEPTWWRFTDWDTPNGKTILTSADI